MDHSAREWGKMTDDKTRQDWMLQFDLLIKAVSEAFCDKSMHFVRRSPGFAIALCANGDMNKRHDWWELRDYWKTACGLPSLWEERSVSSVLQQPPSFLFTHFWVPTEQENRDFKRLFRGRSSALLWEIKLPFDTLTPQKRDTFTWGLQKAPIQRLACLIFSAYCRSLTQTICLSLQGSIQQAAIYHIWLLIIHNTFLPLSVSTPLPSVVWNEIGAR